MQLVLKLKSQIHSLTTLDVRADGAFGRTLHSPAKVPEMMCVPDLLCFLLPACLPRGLAFEAETSDLPKS